MHRFHRFIFIVLPAFLLTPSTAPSAETRICAPLESEKAVAKLMGVPLKKHLTNYQRKSLSEGCNFNNWDCGPMNEGDNYSISYCNHKEWVQGGFIVTNTGKEKLSITIEDCKTVWKRENYKQEKSLGHAITMHANPGTRTLDWRRVELGHDVDDGSHYTVKCRSEVKIF